MGNISSTLPLQDTLKTNQHCSNIYLCKVQDCMLHGEKFAYLNFPSITWRCYVKHLNDIEWIYGKSDTDNGCKLSIELDFIDFFSLLINNNNFNFHAVCWVPFFCVNIVIAFCKTCIGGKTFKILSWLGELIADCRRLWLVRWPKLTCNFVLVIQSEYIYKLSSNFPFTRLLKFSVQSNYL